jgi:hypothetical protein
MRCRWDPVYPTSGRWVSQADSNLRASDAERNEVADKLSRHYADGRLDQTEFKARLDRAIGATTRGDLKGLFDDLPRLADETPPRHRHRSRLLSFILIVALVAVAAGSTISYLHFPWLLLAVAGLFLWRRTSRHHLADHTRSEIGR